MNKSKTTFETINNALATLSKYCTLQNNDVNEYARVCIKDEFKKDSYKIMKDFAIYYNRVDSYKISIADSTLTDCKVFKDTHNKTEKTKALEFSVKSDKLFDTVCEILKQRFAQTEKTFTLAEKQSTTVKKIQKTTKKVVNK